LLTRGIDYSKEDEKDEKTVEESKKESEHRFFDIYYFP
jgi:hypothetical protein